MEKGFQVFALLQRCANDTAWRLRVLDIDNKVHTVDEDLIDLSSMSRAIETTGVSEVYNLGAQSFVETSWNQPVLTSEVTGVAVTRILEAICIVQS